MIWDDIISIARWTPSPHNTQPWKVDVLDDSHARLLLDHRRALPKEDVTGFFIISALGCFIQSVRLLAANRGYRLICNPVSAPPEDHLEPFADLQLEKIDTPTETIDESLFRTRQTSRLPTRHAPLPTETLSRLRAIAEPYQQSIIHISDPTTVDHLMQANLDAVVSDINSRDYHDEVVSWFRFTQRAAKRTRDGLSAKCMTIPPAEFFLFAHAPWAARLPLIGSIFRKQYQRRIGATQHLLALSGPFWNREAATQAGECLMRLWLEMAAHNLYIHPFGNLVTNHKAKSSLDRITGDPNIWIVFRIGATPTPPQSERLLTEELIHA